jgi:hypothetical protein
MEQQQYDKIWNEVLAETYNRSQGSFKRALWYGNNSSVFGQNKGLRKAIRNAPKQIAMAGLGAGLDAAAVPPGLSDLIEAATDVVLAKGKDIYSTHVKPLLKSNTPASTEEALRKKVKSEVKELKANAFQVIDRNLVKLRDAKKKVTPAVKEMMQAMSHTGYATVPSNVAGHTEEAQGKKAHDALRAVAETEYYIDKVLRLAAATRDALQRIETDLNALKQKTVQTRNDIEGYIKEVL